MTNRQSLPWRPLSFYELVCTRFPVHPHSERGHPWPFHLVMNNAAMREDLVAFGLAMLNGERRTRPPTPHESLVAYAVDVADHVAVSIIVERSHPRWIKWQQFWRRDGVAWHPAGRSSFPADSMVLRDRRTTGEPTLTHKASAAAHLLIHSGRWPWSGRYLSWRELEAAGDVRHVVVAGESTRQVEVPWHGQVIVVWPTAQRIERLGPGFGVSAGPSRRSPRMTGRTGSGRSVEPERPR